MLTISWKGTERKEYPTTNFRPIIKFHGPTPKFYGPTPPTLKFYLPTLPTPPTLFNKLIATEHDLKVWKLIQIIYLCKMKRPLGQICQNKRFLRAAFPSTHGKYGCQEKPVSQHILRSSFPYFHRLVINMVIIHIRRS